MNDRMARPLAWISVLVLAAIATQPARRRVNLTLTAVICFGAFYLGDPLLGWQQKSVRAIAEYGGPIRPGSVSPVRLDFERLMIGPSPHSIDIRVGPARPGRIHINGDAKGAVARTPKAYIEVQEVSALRD